MGCAAVKFAAPFPTCSVTACRAGFRQDISLHCEQLCSAGRSGAEYIRRRRERHLPLGNSMPHETVVHFPTSRERASAPSEENELDAITAELQAIATREKSLQLEIDGLLLRQDNSAREFENRLLNGLRVIANQLLSQSRTATTPEAAAQLSIAARRIASVAPSQCRLNLRDC
jgi:hypothetical protein